MPAYRLEREGADGWQAVTTWLPRGVVDGRGPDGAGPPASPSGPPRVWRLARVTPTG